MKHIVVLGGLLLMVLVPSLEASDGVCGNAPRKQCADTVGMTRWMPTTDPEAIAAAGCFEIPPEPPELTAAQRTLIETVVASHPNGRCHLKVVDGLAAEMSQPEKEAVNAALQAVVDEQQAYEDAATNNDLCNAKLDEIRVRKGQLDTALQGDIDGITNIATAKTELADMMDRLTGAMLKLMECIRGRAGPPPPAP